MALPGERPIEGWKAIARYLERPLRTVQRWESKSLPVRRHEALGVIAFPSELDTWIKRIKQSAPPATDSPFTPPICGDVQKPQGRVLSIGARLRRSLQTLAWVVLALLIVSTVLADSYGLAIAMLWIGGIFVVIRLGGTPLQRACVAVYVIAAMAYTTTASTMPEFHTIVINSTTLRPAAAFLFVLGLKSIPFFVLVLGYWVGSLYGALKSGWKRSYLILGVMFLVVEILLLGVTSGDRQVWSAGVPGRWTLLIGALTILALNFVVWLAGLRYLQPGTLVGQWPLLLCCIIAYCGVAVASYFVDHQHNLINHYYVDTRWPEAYVATNPNVVRDFKDAWPRDLGSRIGPDLTALLNEPSFIEALHHGRFYKQHSDEAFQIFDRAVTYSYRPSSSSTQSPSAFVTVRFPQELADSLRFQPVAEK